MDVRVQGGTFPWTSGTGSDQIHHPPGWQGKGGWEAIPARVEDVGDPSGVDPGLKGKGSPFPPGGTGGWGR